MLDILMGYTFDITATAIIYLFFNKKSLSFDEIYRTKKSTIRIISIIQAILAISLIFWMWN